MRVNTDTMQASVAKSYPTEPAVLSPVVGSRWTLIVRNVMRQRSRNLLLGLLIFFASLVIVFFSQFLEGVSRNFTQNLISLTSGDIYIASLVEPSAEKNIFERDYDYFSLPAGLQAEIAAMPAFQSSSARLEFDAKLVTEEDSIQSRIMAFDFANEPKLRANFNLVEGRMPASGEYGIVVPADLARRHGIKVGDRVRVLARAVNKQVNLIDYAVTGLFTTSNLSSWFDTYTYLDLALARELVNDPYAFTRLNLRLKDGADANAALTLLGAWLQEGKIDGNPPLDATHWRDGAAFFADLTQAMRLSYGIVIGIIVIMMAASLSFSTMMNIIERTKEIATLAALGATPRAISKLLVGESLLLACASAFAGVACAALLFLITAKTGIPIGMKELSGFLGASHFYPAFNASGFIAGLIVPVAVAFLSSFIFARRAAKLPIVDALADR